MTIKSSFKYRYVVAVLTWFGFFSITSLRTNISVTIVAMVNNTGIFENTTSSTECLAKNRTFQEQQYVSSLLSYLVFYLNFLTKLLRNFYVTDRLVKLEYYATRSRPGMLFLWVRTDRHSRVLAFKVDRI